MHSPVWFIGIFAVWSDQTSRTECLEAIQRIIGTKAGASKYVKGNLLYPQRLPAGEPGCHSHLPFGGGARGKNAYPDAHFYDSLDVVTRNLLADCSPAPLSRTDLLSVRIRFRSIRTETSPSEGC